MASGLEAIFRQGAAALEADDLTGAERLFASIVEIDPRSHSAWNALSVVAVRSGFPDVALERAKHALEFDRRNPVYLNSLGIACGELGLFGDAENAFRRALKAKPGYTEGLFNLGKVLHKQGRLDEAARTYERAYAIDGGFPGLPRELIAVYRGLGSADRALALLREKPAGLKGDDFAELWAACIAEVEGTERAITWLGEQIKQHPERYGMRFARSVMLLGQARWREGWREYLWRPHLLPGRVDADGRTQAPADLPLRLDGKSVLLRGEQGIGDVLLFLRFARLLRDRGARITLTCDRKLASIVAVQDPLEMVREPAPDDASAPLFDYRVWCGDLPALLDTDVVPPAWAFKVGEAAGTRAKQQLAALGPGPYLGVTWRAGTDTLRRREFGNERNVLMKEIPPAALGAAVRGWHGTVLALQRGMPPEDLTAFAQAAEAPVHDLASLADDLNSLLAVLALLDEYVAVSNTNIHLLAGLGRSARVLVPYPAEWRWGREGASAWFPEFAVYRQAQSRDWVEPLTELRRSLIG